MPKKPRVEWAFFCNRAERHPSGYFNASQILHTIQRINRPGVGLSFAFVYAIDAAPNSKHTLILQSENLVMPPQEITCDFDDAGFFDGYSEVEGMPFPPVGDFRIEFRFDGEETPSHIATIRVMRAEDSWKH